MTQRSPSSADRGDDPTLDPECGCVSRLRQSNRLLVVMLNPSAGGGARTLGRVSKLQGLVGLRSIELANLCIEATHSARDLRSLPPIPNGWSASRPATELLLDNADAVLFAFGVAPPAGEARAYFREEVNWLRATTVARGLPVWQVGGRPHHPSRWQRHTFRVWPGLDFDRALVRSVHRLGCEWPRGDVGGQP